MAGLALSPSACANPAPVVNAMGTMTSLGGSRMSPTVLQAIAHASRSYVDINKLYVAAGERVAELCKCPTGYSAQICTGAAASLALAAAACMTLNEPDESSVLLLPDRADQLQRRIILVDGGSDTRWEQAIKSTGGLVHRLGRAGGARMTADDLASAPWDRAAAFFYFAGGLPEQGTAGCSPVPFSSLLSECRKHNVPLVVDAAAQLPPRSNLWRWTSQGADACVFSGGKSIGGPQGTGILLAKNGMIERVRRIASPHEDSVGRPLKVAKECVAGLVAALEEFVDGSDEEELAGWTSMAEKMVAQLTSVPGLSARIVCPGPPDIQPNHIPRVYVDIVSAELAARLFTPLSEAGAHLPSSSPSHGILGDSVDHSDPLRPAVTSPQTAMAVMLANGSPIVGVNTSDSGIVLNPQTLTKSEADTVVRRIREVVASVSGEERQAQPKL